MTYLLQNPDINYYFWQHLNEYNYSKDGLFSAAWSRQLKIYTGQLHFTNPPTANNHYWCQELKKQKLTKKDYLQGKLTLAKIYQQWQQNVSWCLVDF
jgi:hypothetical protein